MVSLCLRLLMHAQDRVTARCSGCHQSVKPYTFFAPLIDIKRPVRAARARFSRELSVSLLSPASIRSFRLQVIIAATVTWAEASPL